MVLAGGTEVPLTLPNAEYLNSQGIVTGLNFIGGLRAFGNRTACYPANTDPKDAFIPIRRMMGLLQKSVENRLSTALFVSEDFKLEKTITR